MSITSFDWLQVLDLLKAKTGTTWTELAQQLGVSKTTMDGWLYRKVIPRECMVRKARKLLKVTQSPAEHILWEDSCTQGFIDSTILLLGDLQDKTDVTTLRSFLFILASKIAGMLDDSSELFHTKITAETGTTVLPVSIMSFHPLTRQTYYISLALNQEINNVLFKYTRMLDSTTKFAKEGILNTRACSSVLQDVFKSVKSKPIRHKNLSTLFK